MKHPITICLLLTGILSQNPPEEEFSIALIADIHYEDESTKPDIMKRLISAVELINEKTEEENIQLVGILGDLATYTKANILDVIEALNKLRIPYIPLPGNDDISYWDDGAKIFSELFETHFTTLSNILNGWEKTQVPVLDPETNKIYYLVNYAFNLNGLRIICSDWNSRLHHTPTNFFLRHAGHLYDFEGGSWQFLKQQVQKHAHTKYNKILFFSHIPMHHSIIDPAIKMSIAAFSVKDFHTIKQFTKNYEDYLAINFAGHYHYPFHQYILDGGYEVIILYALQPLFQKFKYVFYKPRIGLLKVKSKVDKFDFSYKYLMVPYEDSE